MGTNKDRIREIEEFERSMENLLKKLPVTIPNWEMRKCRPLGYLNYIEKVKDAIERLRGKEWVDPDDILHTPIITDNAKTLLRRIFRQYDLTKTLKKYIRKHASKECKDEYLEAKSLK